MTRLLRSTVLALYAASLAAAVLALCPCPVNMKADAHACCAKTGLEAASSDCCRGATLQPRAPAVPERASLAPQSAVLPVAGSVPTSRPACAIASLELVKSPSPPSVLRI